MRPFRGRIRRPVAIAEPSRHGTHREDGRISPDCLQQRHAAVEEIELGLEIDVDRAVDIGVGIGLDAAGRAGNADIVDQHIESAEADGDVVDDAVGVLRDRGVARRAAEAGVAGKRFIERRFAISVMWTRAPAAANASAITRPMPPAPAVTRTSEVAHVDCG